MGNIAQAFGGQAFDPSQYKDEQTFEPLPKGEYIFEVKGGDVEPTKNGLGAKMLFEVMDGEFTGRTHRQCYNLRNASKEAEDIGQKQFASLCKACGVPLCKSTDELLGRYFVAKIGPQKKDPTWIEIKSHKPIQRQSAPATAPQPQTVAQPQQQPAQVAPAQPAQPGGKLPWER